MSGFTPENAISLIDDDDDEVVDFSVDEVDVQDYDSDIDDHDGDATIAEEDELYIYQSPPSTFVPPLKTFEIPSLSLECGNLRIGTIVELRDHSGRESSRQISGDFFLIRVIVEDVETEKVTLKGYRMRRVEYMLPLFDKKLNDLFMIIETHKNDKRPRFEQGLESIDPSEAIKIRKCVFTNLSQSAIGQSQVTPLVPAGLSSRRAIRKCIFAHGTLICRWVYFVEHETTGKSYGGEARRLFKREATDFMKERQSTSTPHSSGPSLSAPQRCPKLLFGDGFCGCGGASKGAQLAGYTIIWGVDNDATTMEAYEQNVPGALPFVMDAQDFPGIFRRCEHGIYHLHISTVCFTWSQNHTISGVNDEKNSATIFIIGAWLAEIKPETFSLEQVPGLLTKKEHRLFFRMLLNDILEQGYNVRWTIQDQVWFGTPQLRRRLIFVGSKIGFPLPPFPQPQFGPPSSGLKRYVTIGDALKVLEQHPDRFRNDPYHQPHKKKKKKKKNPPLAPQDPNLPENTITTGGRVHYSGTRYYTCRELSLIQGMPVDFHFSGPATKATEQCGNAWPVSSSRVYFETWAAHCEAVFNGYIGPEDEVLDLYKFLEEKGISIDHPAAQVQYRYLHKIKRTVEPRLPLQIWTRQKKRDPLPRRSRGEGSSSSTNARSMPRAGERASVTVVPRHRSRPAEDDNGFSTIDDSE